MGFKLLSKALLVALCAKSVISQPVKGKCAEAVDYFSNKTYGPKVETEYLMGTDVVMHCAEKNGKITELTLFADCLTEEDVNKMISGNPIEKLSIYHDNFPSGDEYPKHCDVLNLIPKSISKLTTLKSLGLDYHYRLNKNDFARIPSSVKELTLGTQTLGQKEINVIASLSNLESIKFSSTKFAEGVDYTPFENLKKLTSVDFDQDYPRGAAMRNVNVNNELIKHFPNLKYLRVAHLNVQGVDDNGDEVEEIDVSPLTKLEELIIYDCNLKTVPENVKYLKNLKVLNLDRNYDVYTLPEFLCNFKNLSISLEGTHAKKLKCPKKTTTTTTKAKPTTTKTTSNAKPTTKVSTDGRCGPEFGSCPSGYCCSKWGWCGVTDAHCSVSAGCLSEFGKCN